MIEIYNSIFIGDQHDYELIKNENGWAILHCCKHPHHMVLTGYSGNLHPSHPDFKYKKSGNRLALNLVDVRDYNEKYLQYYKEMFADAFCFLDEYYLEGRKILIHCNKGESRAPTIAMMYATKHGAFGESSFSAAATRLSEIYPNYNPKIGIFKTIELLWGHFVR